MLLLFNCRVVLRSWMTGIPLECAPLPVPSHAAAFNVLTAVSSCILE